MENIKAKVVQVSLGEKRGTVMFEVNTGKDKDKKEVARIAISYTDPKQAARFEISKEYLVKIDAVK